MERYLGIDYGTVRIGLALGTMQPAEYTTLANDANTLTGIAKIISDEEVTAVVIGQPQRSQGEKGTLHEEIEQFIEGLKQLNPDVTYDVVDEAFSSSQAESELQEMGLSVEQARKRVDQFAAKLLLEQYISNTPAK